MTVLAWIFEAKNKLPAALKFLSYFQQQYVAAMGMDMAARFTLPVNLTTVSMLVVAVLLFFLTTAIPLTLVTLSQ